MNPPNEVTGLHTLLRRARQRSGLTQSQLAGLSTVSIRTIRDLERGRVQRPRHATLMLLADAMRLSETRRAELQLAADESSVEAIIRGVFGPECAAPPRPLRPLIGRQAELEALDALLTRSSERLLAMVGLPGVGKSRLVQEAANLLHTRDRLPVIWVPDTELPAASGVHDPQANLVGWVRELLTQQDRCDGLVTVIGDTPALIVLDGFDLTPEAGAALVRLLHLCPRLKVLATTCRPVQIPGCRLLPLAPLPVPAADLTAGLRPGDSLSAGSPAVELMLSCVSHTRPDILPTDSVVAGLAGLCRALDGVPAVLEAAASWLLLYSPEHLLSMARTAPLELVDGITPAGPLAQPFSTRLARVHGELDGRLAALLTTLAGLPDSWTVDQAATAAGLARPEAARDVHALLLRGLVRQLPAGADGLVTFHVLHLARRLAVDPVPFAEPVEAGVPVVLSADNMPAPAGPGHGGTGPAADNTATTFAAHRTPVMLSADNTAAVLSADNIPYQPLSGSLLAVLSSSAAHAQAAAPAALGALTATAAQSLTGRHH